MILTDTSTNSQVETAEKNCGDIEGSPPESGCVSANGHAGSPSGPSPRDAVYWKAPRHLRGKRKATIYSVLITDDQGDTVAIKLLDPETGSSGAARSQLFFDAECKQPVYPKECRQANGKRKLLKSKQDRREKAAADEERPEIEVTTQRHAVHEATIQTLSKNPDLYRRGNVLGVIIEEAEDETKLSGGIELVHARGTAHFLPLGHAALGCQITRYADFYKVTKDKNGEPVATDCHPPDWLISVVSETPRWPGVRWLNTIAECPSVRADGSITEPGYDPATGAFFRHSLEIGSIPRQPNREDAKKAARRLFRVVHQYPFDGDHSRPSWLAALLTAIQRPMIVGPVPGCAIVGNKPGTGKGLLVDSVGITANGHLIPTRTYPKDPAEADKVKLSIALAAVTAIHFDNLDEGASYGGGVIDSALTSRITDGRILGQNKDAGGVPLRPCWFLSGNNLSPWKDAYRRWLRIDLTTDLESPHERKDLKIKDLRAYVLEHRAELLRDALIILRAHAIAGRPTGDWGPLGSFEEWDPIVRGAVWFATDIDCTKGMKRAHDESPEVQEDLALLKAWHETYADKEDGATIQEAIELAKRLSGSYPALFAALDALRDKTGSISVTEIQYRFRRLKTKIVKGYQLVSNGEDRSHRTKWRVRRVEVHE